MPDVVGQANEGSHAQDYPDDLRIFGEGVDEWVVLDSRAEKSGQPDREHYRQRKRTQADNKPPNAASLEPPRGRHEYKINQHPIGDFKGELRKRRVRKDVD